MFNRIYLLTKTLFLGVRNMTFSYLFVGNLIKEGKSHGWQIKKPRRGFRIVEIKET